MYCAECGTANSVGAETCEVCGSPLGSSSGEQICHACGAPIDEHDRFCRACGQSQSGASAGRFEPGPSFVDDSSLEVDASELPPWLREMTAAKFQHENGHVAASAAVVEQSDALPSWLDSASTENGNGHKTSPRPSQAPSMPAPRNDEPAETFSLISEDDLPEWLRALGDQEFETESTPPAALNSRAIVPPAVTSATPAISRAWLSRSRDTETESAGQVASDFAPLESGPAISVTRRATPQTDELTPLPLEEQTVPVQDVMDASAQSDTRRVRLIMLSVVVLLVVILGYYAVSNFL